ncbi:MAG: hypothetical protein R6X02_27965 [Enhygromyxa sp.]
MIEPRIVAVLALAGLCACQEPPPRRVDRVDPPKLEHEREQAQEFRRKAHEEALTEALPLARAALVAGDPLGAWQAGQGPAAIPLLTLGQRAVLDERLTAARTAIVEIDEAYLSPASVVILRAVQFGVARLEDELGRRTPLRRDPLVALRAVEAVLDELVYRTLHDDCDAGCEALAGELALALPDTRAQLVGASLAASERAAAIAPTLAERSRELGERALLQRYPTLRAGLGQLATALDAHGEWLTEFAAALPKSTRTPRWTDKPAPIRPGVPQPGAGEAKRSAAPRGPTAPGAGPAPERLPDVIGPLALSRRMAAEELIILEPERDLARVGNHVGRWHTLGRELVGEQPVAAGALARVDVERCEAALARISAGLAKVEGLEAPRLSCERYVELLGAGELLDEAALILDLLELGVIEPQRRTLRAQELAELAVIAGQWSTQVHTHLRRVMLLARLDEPAALKRAIEDGTMALCLAEAALWVHSELALPSALADALGPKCAALGPERAELAELAERVLGDPRGALAGFGLSLIGDEPARMVGFDRFFWAPLGLMQTLATPTGVHPDQFTLPDDPPSQPEPAIEVDLEPLGGAR